MLRLNPTSGWSRPPGAIARWSIDRRLRLRFEPLARHHDRSAFCSGEAALDDWFQKRAGQDDRRNVARVFVALDGKKIAGFYSLGAFSFGLDDLPREQSTKLPRYDAIPAALIGRLARDEHYRGKGVGELLLADAIHRALFAAQSLAIHAIAVDAKNEAVLDFYLTYGFIPFPLNPDRLFVTAAKAAAAFLPKQL